eukprot:TRINITY_DN2866_c0_g1_i2.p1 TRINITY_DN2866_c0_g1~~TRINITY_DN2866_c0_g1_i2.p1  ORF type:complete len:367 (+),score=60.39 TRINITY_DN2866_c0_g1_i2:145-1101(+)
MNEVYNSPKAFRWKWKSGKQRTALIVQKPVPELLEKTEYISGLLKARGVKVLVTDATHDALPHLKRFGSDEESGLEKVDLVVSLGGDGTFIYASSLFEKKVPPIVAFNLGTLGFLTPFNFDEADITLNGILDDGCFVNRRIRLFCRIIKADKTIIKQTEKVLNEVFISRGDSPLLTKLDCYCDDSLITTVHADGVILATPTGSTAYSLSAGGPLMHPSIPAVLFTPICPHSLSFRPVILPGNAELKFVHPAGATGTVQVQYDGRTQVTIQPGDAVAITVSKWAVPAVSKTDTTNEWFRQLAVKLNWNAMAKGNFRMLE